MGRNILARGLHLSPDCCRQPEGSGRESLAKAAGAVHGGLGSNSSTNPVFTHEQKPQERRLAVLGRGALV